MNLALLLINVWNQGRSLKTTITGDIQIEITGGGVLFFFIFCLSHTPDIPLFPHSFFYFVVLKICPNE